MLQGEGMCSVSMAVMDELMGPFTNMGPHSRTVLTNKFVLKPHLGIFHGDFGIY